MIFNYIYNLILKFFFKDLYYKKLLVKYKSYMCKNYHVICLDKYDKKLYQKELLLRLIYMILYDFISYDDVINSLYLYNYKHDDGHHTWILKLINNLNSNKDNEIISYNEIFNQNKNDKYFKSLNYILYELKDYINLTNLKIDIKTALIKYDNYKNIINNEIYKIADLIICKFVNDNICPFNECINYYKLDNYNYNRQLDNKINDSIRDIASTDAYQTVDFIIEKYKDEKKYSVDEYIDYYYYQYYKSNNKLYDLYYNTYLENMLSIYDIYNL